MPRFFKNRSEMLGKHPGELIHIGKINTEETRIRVIDYNQSELFEKSGIDIIDDNSYIHSENNSWINIDCLHDLKLMERISLNYGLHPLVMADILNTGLRPKIEELDNGLFIVLKMLRYDQEKQEILSEQFSMIVRDNHLLTFQERAGDVFENVRERIRKKKGRIVSEKIDFLTYSLMDAIVDNYILIVEQIGTEIENLEVELLSKPSIETVEKITLLKKELIYLRKSIRPAREAILFLNKCENPLLKDSTFPFLNDLLSNITQVSEVIDSYKEMLTEHMNTYNSIMSNKLNDIMKVLTIFSVIFIPLTFIAGIYGTNFDFIPELHLKYGYFFLWLILILVASSMIIYFKKRKWF
ncbi:MAG: magnesium/cobalt transporter CorA [Spirochaetaceae bacterium]|nr:magnesium/cobalt transporter CorA [Spirochaetaceae bacterium]